MSEKKKVLIVDDERLNLTVLSNLLKSDYKTVVAKSGEQALERAGSEVPPDLILLDIMMPEMDGYEVCRRLKDNPATRDIPVIFVTALNDAQDETRGFELGAVDYLTKPISPAVVAARVRTHLELRAAREILKNQNALLERMVEERTRELDLTKDATIHSLAALAETRDPETGAHIRRTQHYVRILAEHVRLRPEFQSELTDEVIALLFKSAPLHDIGKVGVPDSVLLKPGKLTDEEFEEMKRHTTYGRDALLNAEKVLGGTNSFLSFAIEIAHTHQEKWDGSGYPQGLAGRNIPLSGRLMAVADVYDALISKRCYKPAFTHERAVEIITEGRGQHFDPILTDGFLEISEEFRKIATQFQDE